MTDTKTPATETDHNENTNTPSDARIILGPLVKYAAMGAVLVAIILTTVVMMDRQFNDIDHEVAELEAELAKANAKNETDATAEAEQTISQVEVVAVDEEPVVTEVATTTVTVAEQHEIKAAASATAAPTAVESASVAATTETTPVTKAVAGNTVSEAMMANDEFFIQPMDEIIAERNAYLKERDLEYLQAFKASHDKKLESMRERLARQEQRIKEMESRYQEIYEIRAADMKEMQERRESFLTDRI
jgi:hypothetical protein